MIALATIAYNRPHMVTEQIRLLSKNLIDSYQLVIFDTSSDSVAARRIKRICANNSIEYARLKTHAHHEGLNIAAKKLLAGDAPYIGFLDHDIFPTKPTSIVAKVSPAGFYGIGQRHAATGHLYLWPGFLFFSRAWLSDRPFDLGGIRDGDARNDGDTGSAAWPLFADEDWQLLYRPEHTYEVIREPDEFGLQSWGVEHIDEWLHLSNASDWMAVPNPKEREKILSDMLVAL